MASRRAATHGMYQASIPSGGTQQPQGDLRICQAPQSFKQLAGTINTRGGMRLEVSRLSNGSSQELKIVEDAAVTHSIPHESCWQFGNDRWRGSHADSNGFTFSQIQGEA